MTVLRRAATAASAIPLLMALAATPALAAPARLSIPAGPLDQALFALARQSGEQLLFTPESVRGRTSPAVEGAYTTDEALSLLLAGSGLTATRTGPSTVVIQAVESAAQPRPFDGEAPAQPPETAVVATLDEVRVTGSHIRGGDSASPLRVFDRAALERSGHGSVASALNALPQMFAGQATEGTQATRADAAGSNTTFATSVNLRGLGPSATLVLINGRRVSGAGSKGEFVDLSTIPTVAVERVEILLDGASAVYGSDAVGGVVNIVLRKAYDGLELKLRAGTATAGEPQEAQLGVTFGRRWSGGSLLAVYEGSRRTALNAADRAITASADLRRFGGSDRRETFAFPGNIVGVDPLTGVSGPRFGIPAGQTGVALTPSDFTAGVLNRTTAHEGMDILPDQRQHTGYLAVRQEVAPWLELSADARYGYRRARALQPPSTASLSVTPANPFFVSPTGSTAPQQIAYSFAGELPNTPSYRHAESFTATVAADARLPRDWDAGGYLAYSREVDTGDLYGTINSAILAEALGGADRPETAFLASRDGYFNPYTGLAANRPAVLAAISSGFTTTRTAAEVYTASLQADGPLFALPAGEAKLAVGGQARREEFRTAGYSFLSTPSPAASTPIQGDRTVLGAFAELRAPLLSDREGRPALELSLAVRAEDYSDFGRSINPKAGLVWRPAESLRLRATWGESFRAPTLRDLRATTFNSAINLPGASGTALVMTRQGGNPDLGPESATSWTLGADWTPSVLPDLRLGATVFRTRFRDRIDRPAASSLATVLTDARFAPFVQRLNPATSAADLALIRQILADPITRATTFPAESFTAIVDIRMVNTGVLEVSGLDLNGSYGRDAWGGRLTLAADATRLFDFAQQLTPSSPKTDVVGQTTRPPRLRARLSADWRREAWSLGLAANHTSGFRDPAGVRIDSHTTYDLQAGWTAKTDPGLSLRLTVRNLFDEAPPFYDSPLGFAYDPTSGDPVGRFVALQLTRSW
ncbi:TonB-dependent receptor [Phenylobacterium zucineum HLK1]|uniref:TonB-dependent receptor n=1 Tax=Phenylobacterium zucineum (strain HLK1) TaxID=450851 RepID=B4RFZ2_PHEZH|nr:TonB-dependent receptor [Phenylobacterium zucineum]ACG78805.1 TonB-dependent receptor [Phenylobacterium zucineum HLK1]